MNSKIFKLFLVVAMGLLSLPAMAQNCYWVFLADKQGTSFDPYSYFDAKAIQRYKLNNADLYDISNYPLNDSYVAQVNALAQEEVGQTRWLNAMAVMASSDQIEQIAQLPFVSKVQLIATDFQLAQARQAAPAVEEEGAALQAPQDIVLADQVLRMKGQLFHDKGINGKGVRVAVFDGGFPNVNTHKAFKHIRDDHRIIATWNFCDKKEDVYGWNGHGTMVLSCIAGIYDSLQLGLATGAEFLLARTEVEPEPYKEEVWWMMAVEWADKNGADVVNSSLGYGKDRHYTYEMDGRSYVAHAANLAARKGIIVCNSAGNEGDDNKWKTIITPGDADSILTVGGIEASLSSYKHISFSSFGPTADGRLKPNVCNFGQVIVAKPRTDDESEIVFGTSFSSPLTAGFCACVRQLRPNLTAMQVKEEVERSADLYPYFDYAFGYGVPQADYFLSDTPKQVEPTFRFVERDGYVMVQPTGAYVRTTEGKPFDGTVVKNQDSPKYTIFFKVTDRNNVIQQYTNLEFDDFGPSRAVAFPNKGLYQKTLTVSLGGYTDSYRLPDAISKKLLNSGDIDDYDYAVIDTNGYYDWSYDEGIDRTPDDLTISKFKDHCKLELSLGMGAAPHLNSQEIDKTGINYAADFRMLYSLRRWYSLGFGLGVNFSDFTYKNAADPVASALSISGQHRGVLEDCNYALELFQRIRIIPGGSLTHNGLFWDLGIFGAYNDTYYNADFSDSGMPFQAHSSHYTDLAPYDLRWNWGITSRIVYDWIGLYARYRLGSYGTAGALSIGAPRLQVGVMVNF